MRTNELFAKKTVFSFEVFPPKKDSPPEILDKALSQLHKLSPDFISVTCGAGGKGGDTTVEIASKIKNAYASESVAHLPCINFTKENVLEILEKLKKNGIENILALRGDKSPDIEPKTDFRYASDLVDFIKRNGDFNIIAACYPEGHAEAESLEADILNLKRKADAGADQLISQLFFDNDLFYSFLDKARAAGIKTPVQAGIMPLTNIKQIQHIIALCGVNVPQKLRKIIERYEISPDELRNAGIDYAVEQIAGLISHKVDGVHLYTMNNPHTALSISEAVSNLLAGAVKRPT